MNALELRRRTLGKGVCKKTVEGNPAIAQGSLARRYPGITMQGWTEQDSTTGAQLFDASKISTKSEGGVNVTNNGDGSFTISGEGKLSGIYSNNITIPYESFFEIKEGPLSLLCDRTYPYFFFQLLNKNNEIVVNITSSNNTVEITQDIVQSIKKVIMGFYGSVGEDIEPGAIKPMVYQDGDGTWEPYTGGQPSPNPDYPQEITSAGKYDEGMGKYQYTIKISDSEESPTKSQTALLTSDRPLTKWDKLEKRDGVWGWVYKSGSYIFDGSTDENWNVTASSKYTFTIDINGAMFNNSFCDRYICKLASWISNDFGIYSDNGFATKYFRPPSADVETVEQWKTFLSQNPLTVVCETAEETFVPLTTAEQEQMNTLYTFRPTTVLSNDCECEMTLTYKTKKSLEVTT